MSCSGTCWPLGGAWQIDGETVETVSDFILGGSKITVDGDCSHEIKTLTPWKESYDQPSVQETCPNPFSLHALEPPCPTLCNPIDGSPPGSAVIFIWADEHCAKCLRHGYRVDLTNLLLFRVWSADRQHLCHLEIDRNVAFQVSHPRYGLSRWVSSKQPTYQCRKCGFISMLRTKLSL